jgi:general stress protein 26
MYEQATEQEFEEVLGEFEIAVLTTRGSDGHFHARPMALQGHPRSDALWFATSRDSEKCRHIREDAQVGLSFHEGARDADYLSISGRAELVEDRVKMHELWDASWRAWFPDGPDQEDLVLIRVIPEHAEWVKPRGGKLKVLATMARNAVTGSREEPAEKKAVDLH